MGKNYRKGNIACNNFIIAIVIAVGAFSTSQCRYKPIVGEELISLDMLKKIGICQKITNGSYALTGENPTQFSFFT